VLVAAVFAGCGPPDAATVARNADGAYHTSAFSWLVSHEPSAVVVRQADLALVRAVIPGARVTAAGPSPCRQAKAEHALLLVVAPASARAERERANDCGFAVEHDAGAVIVAPL
jgi:hypothetical protein